MEVRKCSCVVIKEFASKHRLKTSVDGEETVIRGRQGQIFEYSDTTLGTMFMPDEHNEHPTRSYARKWNKLREACVAAGMAVQQEAEFEGTLTFDPANKAQIKLALKIAGVRPKRAVSPEQKARLASILANARQKASDPCQEAR